jgi:hypothetical protein
MHAGVETDQFWFPEEIAALYPLPEQDGGKADAPEPEDAEDDRRVCPSCGYRWPG